MLSGGYLGDNVKTLKPEISTNQKKEDNAKTSTPQPKPNTAKEEPTSQASLETKHISVTTYNPFKELGTNQLFVDLDGAADGFEYPVFGKFSSAYGTRGSSFHDGVDITAPANSPIYAAFDGTVRLSTVCGDYGNAVVVRHTNGLETVYAHNAKNLVKVGDEVEAGDEIALIGKSGNATNNSLHFEVRVNGKTIDPELILDKDSETIQGGMLIVKTDANGNVTAERLEENNAAPTATKDSGASASSSKGVMINGKLYDAPDKPEVKAPEKKYHKVVRGDTLSHIAEKYGVGLSKVYALNGMNRHTVIKVGQKIRVQ